MSEWLIGLTCAAMLVAVARCLMPPGAVQQVGGLVCALLLLWAVLRPLAPLFDRLDKPDITVQAWEVQTELKEKEGQMLKSLIEQECGTYIVDKAAELGAVCKATVHCEMNSQGVWLPERCQIAGQLTLRQQDELSQLIFAQLGIVPQQQRYTGGG